MFTPLLANSKAYALPMPSVDPVTTVTNQIKHVEILRARHLKLQPLAESQSWPTPVLLSLLQINVHSGHRLGSGTLNLALILKKFIPHFIW
jgi:hypothetical protein